MNNNVIFDMTNLAWIIRFSEKLSTSKKEKFAKELIAGKCISAICDISANYRATGVLLAIDSPNTWRKDLYSDYKNRDHGDLYYKDVIDAVDLVCDFFRQNSSVKTCKVPKTEADDIIAVAVQESENVNNVIISSDTDFVQLLAKPGTVLYSPAQKKERTSENPEYDLFEKCIRGDTSDNIFSAYPRIRAKKLVDAFNNEIEMLNLMETVLTDGEKVKDKYEFNKTLIDLTKQPKEYRDAIISELSNDDHGTFSQSGVMKYIAQNGLNAISDLSMKPTFLKLMKSKYVFK